MESSSDELLRLGGLPCWHAGGKRLLAFSGSMILSGIQDGSGTDESFAEMGYSLGCLLGCLLAWSEVNVEWVIVSIKYKFEYTVKVMPQM